MKEEDIIIPFDVWEVMNNHAKGFDKMYYKHYKHGVSQEKAFQMSVDRVREYFDEYDHYSSFRSYLISKAKRYRKGHRYK